MVQVLFHQLPCVLQSWTTYTNAGWILSFGSTAAGNVVANIGSGTVAATVTSTTTIGDGAWHHVMMVVDRAGGALYLYLDGGLAGSATVASSLSVGTTTYPVVLGQDGPRAGAYYNAGTEPQAWILDHGVCAAVAAAVPCHPVTLSPNFCPAPSRQLCIRRNFVRSPDTFPSKAPHALPSQPSNPLAPTPCSHQLRRAPCVESCIHQCRGDGPSRPPMLREPRLPALPSQPPHPRSLLRNLGHHHGEPWNAGWRRHRVSGYLANQCVRLSAIAAGTQTQRETSASSALFRPRFYELLSLLPHFHMSFRTPVYSASQSLVQSANLKHPLFPALLPSFPTSQLQPPACIASNFRCILEFLPILNIEGRHPLRLVA